MSSDLIAAFTVEGPPTTKKTSQQIIYVGKGRHKRPKLVPDRRTKAWQGKAATGMRWSWMTTYRRLAPHDGDVHVEARVYRPFNTTGDLVGYLQAIGDALQESGVLANDRQIKSWDGSRLFVDKDWPRVELFLRPMTGE